MMLDAILDDYIKLHEVGFVWDLWYTNMGGGVEAFVGGQIYRLLVRTHSSKVQQPQQCEVNRDHNIPHVRQSETSNGLMRRFRKL